MGLGVISGHLNVKLLFDVSKKVKRLAKYLDKCLSL